MTLDESSCPDRFVGGSGRSKSDRERELAFLQRISIGAVHGSAVKAWKKTTPRVAGKDKEWSIAVQMVLLSVGLCAVTVVLLTLTGYRSAKGGLNSKPEAGLSIEAQLASQAVGVFSQSLLSYSNRTAGNLSTRQMLELRTVPNSNDISNLQDVQNTVDKSRTTVLSVAIVRPDRSIFLDSSDPHQSNLPANDAFLQAMNGRDAISSIALSPTTGKPVIYVASPINSQTGSIIGVVSLQASLTRLDAIIQDSKGRIDKNTFALLLDQDGIVRSTTLDPNWLQHPIGSIPADRLGVLMADQAWGNAQPPASLQLGTLVDQVANRQPHAFNWTLGGRTYRALIQPLTTSDWTYVIALPLSAYNASAQAFLRTAIVTGGDCIGYRRAARRGPSTRNDPRAAPL